MHYQDAGHLHRQHTLVAVIHNCCTNAHTEGMECLLSRVLGKLVSCPVLRVSRTHRWESSSTNSRQTLADHGDGGLHCPLQHAHLHNFHNLGMCLGKSESVSEIGEQYRAVAVLQ